MIAVEEVRLKYDNEFKLKEDLRFSDDCSRSRLDKLPIVVLEFLLKRMDFISRIKLGEAYPKFIHVIIRKHLWRKFYVKLNSSIFDINQLNLMKKFLKDHIARIIIEFQSYDSNELDTLYGFLNNFNLDCFEFSMPSNHTNSRIIDLTCKNFKNIKLLVIDYKFLNNYHLVSITDNLKYLRYFDVTSSNDLCDGLKYFIKNVTHLISLILNVSLLSEE